MKSKKAKVPRNLLPSKSKKAGNRPSRSHTKTKAQSVSRNRPLGPSRTRKPGRTAGTPQRPTAAKANKKKQQTKGKRSARPAKPATKKTINQRKQLKASRSASSRSRTKKPSLVARKPAKKQRKPRKPSKPIRHQKGQSKSSEREWGSKVAGKARKRRKRYARSNKAGEIKIDGRTIPKSVADMLRRLRAKYLKEGQFVSYEDLYEKYNETAKKACDENIKDSEIFGDSEADKEFGIDVVGHNIALEPKQNSIMKVVEDIRDEAQSKGIHIKVYIRGFDDDRLKYYGYHDAMTKIEVQLKYIWLGLEIYKERHLLISPLFSIPMCYNNVTYVTVIDFNDIICESVDIPELLQIIAELLA